MTGKETYSLSNDEKTSAYERADTLPLYAQMMAVAVKGCAELEIMDRDGHYSDSSATIFLTLYSCLNSVGFSFSNDEYDRVLDGTHELYEPWEDAAVEENEIPDDGIMEAYDDSIAENNPSEENGSSTEGEEEIEIDSLDGFIAVDDMTDIPFADKETDLATEPNDEEYPTVYSTEDAPSGISALAQELAGLDEAA